MAFPTLGLTKIIWAIEIILQMNLPDFKPEILGHKQEWVSVCPVDDIPSGVVRYLKVNERNLFVYREENLFRVYDSHCPHRAEDIKPEALTGFTLTCPRHKWAFDMKTGQCISEGTHPLRSFTCKVENNTLYAFW